MELIQIANYISGRFILSNVKKEKNVILKGNLLSSYSIDSLSAGPNEKVYYDTADFFFADRGINIYIVTSGKNQRELIIRYDSEQVERVEFLKNIPNYFKLKIDKGDNISKYYNEISDAIYKIYPSGLQINIDEMLRQSAPRIKVTKKRESYRVVNNLGLKLTLSFDKVDYQSCDKKAKASVQALEVLCDSFKVKDDFYKFLKDMIIDYPKLLKVESNELTVARNYLN